MFTLLIIKIMRNLYFILLHVMLLITFEFSYAQILGKDPESWNIIETLQTIENENILTDDDQHVVWCGSVIEEGGKYYMFYSRWPKIDGHLGWVIKSEVALAVSDNAGGPYRHVKVILPARGVDYWDGTTTHNPYITRHNGVF